MTLFTPLSFVSSAKVLGIWLQTDLKWDGQVDHMWKNSNRRLFMLRSLKKFGFITSELVTVYRGYIRPMVEYSDVIWHSTLTSKQAIKLENIQKRALRIILGCNYVSYDNALVVCNVDKLSDRREQHCLNFARTLSKCDRTTKLLPPSRGQAHGRQLRNNANLSQLRARTDMFARSPVPYFVRLLNSKPS
ncbi:uncharacterized protein [Amphiura filiformis]|uniref:uncharacterized protein n=1 Tax=Amphiura filiformis TaxID=82378 RepID=UPI003B223B23